MSRVTLKLLSTNDKSDSMVIDFRRLELFKYVLRMSSHKQPKHYVDRL